MVFDLIALSISTGFILKHAPRPQYGAARCLSGFSRAMFEQGILYYLSLTLINVTNLVFYRQNKPSVQSSAASLGYVISWVMAQRILIDCTQYFATRSGHVLPAAVAAVNGPMDSMFLASSSDVENMHIHDTPRERPVSVDQQPGHNRVPGASPWLHFVSRARDTTTGMFSISQTLGASSGERTLPVPSEEEIQAWKRPGAILGGDCSDTQVIDVETHRRMSEIYRYDAHDEKGMM
ncbi:hypothetical protein AURDEDRAFT_159425 [Auricularia subglabra TFB-10046 SS5]|nr:hypothetical protein AURDEDRAFT_159425 [Auricularia subglabra TFB-10046 SS5]